MCGIAGIFGQLKGPADQRETMVRSMTDVLERRGPDGQGHVFDHRVGLALGHRRLAVVDLSDAGAQPMRSHSGRHTIVYNGELYNTAELRGFLNNAGSYMWRGHSDTEVLLELIERLGVEAALQRVDGMFAFAVFDHKENTLTLGRDAFGEKPLYFGVWGGCLHFASQLNALTVLPDCTRELDRRAVGYFFKHSYIPAPYSIYRGISKLQPGHFLTVSGKDVLRGDRIEQRPYWDPIASAQSAQKVGFEGSYQDAMAHVEQILQSSVVDRMVSDVPLGSLLSGGIDSSLVTALMTQNSGQVKSFCIGMDQAGFDESDHARAVANHLGTDHTELMLSAKDVLNTVPKLSCIYDEPFSDSSQIPTCLVSALARQTVTVALTGDAGDELMGGYNRYFHGPRVWGKLQKIPMPLRRLGRMGLEHIPMSVLDKVLGAFGGAEFSAGRASEKVKKLAGLLACDTQTAFHDRLLSTAQDTQNTLLDHVEGTPLSMRRNVDMGGLSFMQQMMLNDTINYLPGDILAKVDRASMYASLKHFGKNLNRAGFPLV